MTETLEEYQAYLREKFATEEATKEADAAAKEGHGRRSKYVSGCRCLACTAANTVYTKGVRSRGANPEARVAIALTVCGQLNQGEITVAEADERLEVIYR